MPKIAKPSQKTANSLLFSLFSVRHRALPDLQGMKVGNESVERYSIAYFLTREFRTASLRMIGGEGLCMAIR